MRAFGGGLLHSTWKWKSISCDCVHVYVCLQSAFHIWNMYILAVSSTVTTNDNSNNNPHAQYIASPLAIFLYYTRKTVLRFLTGYCKSTAVTAQYCIRWIRYRSTQLFTMAWTSLFERKHLINAFEHISCCIFKRAIENGNHLAMKSKYAGEKSVRSVVIDQSDFLETSHKFSNRSYHFSFQKKLKQLWSRRLVDNGMHF